MKGNTHVPKTLIWNHIFLPENWLLKKAIPAPRQPPSTVESITTLVEGDVEIKFNRGLHRNISHIYPSNPQVSIPPRFSYSSLLTRFREADNEPRIPQTTYNKQSSSPISPTFLQVTELKDSEIYMVSREFKIDKQTLRKDFYNTI